MKENKIWGETFAIWKGNNTEVHRIRILSGGFCSKHKHEHKFNLFFIESGELTVETWQENGIVDKTVVMAGESTIVRPGQFHRFIANTDTTALEIYWVELNDVDIVRENQGGRSAS